MSIKFKSFQDYSIAHESKGRLGSFYAEAIYATKQVETFIKENNIKYSDIKDIKFSVDSEGNEHILLVYEVPEE